jgi:hypothetical protein
MKTKNYHPIEVQPETIVLMSESEAEEIEGGKDDTGSCRTKTCEYTNHDIYYL